jgi:hypothetical protein
MKMVYPVIRLQKIMLLSISLIVLPLNILGQNNQFPRILDSLENIHKLDSLKTKLNHNKFIPNDLELACFLTLSQYPELCSTKIIFKKAKIKTTLNTRPTIISALFCKKNNRKYVIRINNSSKAEILINQVCFNGKIGLLGHEFAHILDYSKVGFFGVVKRATSYLTNKTKKKYENRIDLLTIKKGFGWQLYDWSDFVLNKSNATDKYKAFKRKIYLSPEQIFMKMNI